MPLAGKDGSGGRCRMTPDSPGSWVRYAVRILEAQSAPHSPRLDHVPSGDFRLHDSKEVAISVKILLERSANGCGGRGPRLLVRLYLGGEPWEVFTESEKYLIRKTERRFRAALRKAGFLPELRHGGGGK